MPQPEYEAASRFVPALLFWPDRKGMKPDRIVIHTTEGSKGGTLNWFRDKRSKVSAHYLVGRDGEVVQCVKESAAAQHIRVSSYNWRSFGIEHEGWAAKNEWTEAQLRASAALTRYLCRKYKIPVDREHVIPHSQWNPADRYDPGPWFDWDYYLALVRGEKDPVRSILRPKVKLTPEEEERHWRRVRLWAFAKADHEGKAVEAYESLKMAQFFSRHDDEWSAEARTMRGDHERAHPRAREDAARKTNRWASQKQVESAETQIRNGLTDNARMLLESVLSSKDADPATRREAQALMSPLRYAEETIRRTGTWTIEAGPLKTGR